jgi:hypothetical protein
MNSPSTNLTIKEHIIWDKVQSLSKKKGFTHLFYVWEQYEQITKKIVGAKGKYPNLQSKIIATKLDPLSFEELISAFNKIKKEDCR